MDIMLPWFCSVIDQTYDKSEKVLRYTFSLIDPEKEPK